MQLRQGTSLQTLKQIQRFLDEHPVELGGVTATATRKRLDKAIEELARSAAVQSGSLIGAKAVTQKVRVLTNAVVERFMTTIAHIAAAELAPLPELSPLATPKTRIVGERLVGLARGMATEAAKYEATFIQAGMAPDFLAKFAAAIDALAASVSERKQREGSRGAATELLPKGLAEAGKVVKILDDFVKAEAAGNRQLLAEWKIVKRQRRSAVATKTVAAPAGGAA